MASSLCLLLLVSCSATRNAAQSPPTPRELARHVLIIHETPEGRVLHTWSSARNFDLPMRPPRAGISTVEGRVVSANWQRDCEAELQTCIRGCMGQDLGEDWEHLVQPPSRKLGGKHAECRRRCWPSYQDCLKQNAEDAAKATRFSTVDLALDWLKQHREELLLGTVVVIAGVAFVVIGVGSAGGALILAPAVLMASPDVSPEPRILAVMP